MACPVDNAKIMPFDLPWSHLAVRKLGAAAAHDWADAEMIISRRV